MEHETLSDELAAHEGRLRAQVEEGWSTLLRLQEELADVRRARAALDKPQIKRGRH